MRDQAPGVFRQTDSPPPRRPLTGWSQAQNHVRSIRSRPIVHGKGRGDALPRRMRFSHGFTPAIPAPRGGSAASVRAPGRSRPRLRLPGDESSSPAFSVNPLAAVSNRSPGCDQEEVSEINQSGA
jgi:hypothetical protein